MDFKFGLKSKLEFVRKFELELRCKFELTIDLKFHRKYIFTFHLKSDLKFELASQNSSLDVNIHGTVSVFVRVYEGVRRCMSDTANGRLFHKRRPRYGKVHPALLPVSKSRGELTVCCAKAIWSSMYIYTQYISIYFNRKKLRTCIRISIYVRGGEERDGPRGAVTCGERYG